MRSVLTLAVLAAVGSAAVAEDLKDIILPARYGVAPAPEFYPQGTPKEALATAATLLEKQRYAYLLAHLVDPVVVDAQVAARVRQLTPAIEKRLADIRADQKRSLRPETRPEDVIPLDPTGFAEKVQAEAEKQAFTDLVKAMQDHLAEFPENVTQLAAVSRGGAIAESGTAATAEAKDVPNKKVLLKQISVAAQKESRVLVDGKPGTRRDPITVPRWFVEDRQAADAEKPKADK
jgi:hypothetical protein